MLIANTVSITRLDEILPEYKGYRADLRKSLTDEFTGYPLHNDIQTFGDLKRIGPEEIERRCPDLGKRPVNWLFKQLEPEA